MKEIWMPHAGHFCAASYCQFRMNTYVNGYIVSTVGEFRTNPERGEFETIGVDRKYETMVFKAEKAPKAQQCCPYRAIVKGGELDFEGYNDANSAREGHMRMLQKWAKKK